MTGVHERDLARAEQALHEALALADAHAKKGVEVEYKDGGSPVTEADRAIDSMLREALPEPGDGWLSEESLDGPERQDCRRVWVVDPIDGTRSFVAGRSDYSVSIGLLIDRLPVLGAIGSPDGVCVVGAVGHGVRVEGTPGTPWTESSQELRLLASRSEMRRGDWQHLTARASIHPVGSVAYKLALVAAGFADATWTKYPKHEWDVAAGAALVLAAGGDIWLPRGGHMLWNRNRPRFLSFAAAQAGKRAAIEPLLE